jgi:hypothetical protein
MIESNKPVTNVQFEVLSDRVVELLPIIGKLVAQQVIVRDSVSFDKNNPELQSQLVDNIGNYPTFNPELVSYEVEGNNELVPIIQNEILESFVAKNQLANKATCTRLINAVYWDTIKNDRSFKYAYVKEGRTLQVSLRADKLSELNRLLENGFFIKNLAKNSKKLLTDLEAFLYLGDQ